MTLLLQCNNNKNPHQIFNKREGIRDLKYDIQTELTVIISGNNFHKDICQYNFCPGYTSLFTQKIFGTKFFFGNKGDVDITDLEAFWAVSFFKNAQTFCFLILWKECVLL